MKKRTTYGECTRTGAQWLAIQECFDAVFAYEKANNVKYTVIARGRPDWAWFDYIFPASEVGDWKIET